MNSPPGALPIRLAVEPEAPEPESPEPEAPEPEALEQTSETSRAAEPPALAESPRGASRVQSVRSRDSPSRMRLQTLRKSMRGRMPKLLEEVGQRFAQRHVTCRYYIYIIREYPRPRKRHVFRSGQFKAKLKTPTQQADLVLSLIHI